MLQWNSAHWNKHVNAYIRGSQMAWMLDFTPELQLSIYLIVDTTFYFVISIKKRVQFKMTSETLTVIYRTLIIPSVFANVY